MEMGEELFNRFVEEHPDKRAEYLLRDGIEAHNKGKCRCDLSEGGYGLCYAGQWLEGMISSSQVIEDLS